MGTEWKTSNIWIRKTFTSPDSVFDALSLAIFHTGDAEVYLNGVLVAELTGSSKGYRNIDISESALHHLKAGYNAIFIHAQSGKAAQFLDVGLLGITTGMEGPVSLEPAGPVSVEFGRRVREPVSGRGLPAGRIYDVSGRSVSMPVKQRLTSGKRSLVSGQGRSVYLVP